MSFHKEYYLINLLLFWGQCSEIYSCKGSLGLNISCCQKCIEICQITNKQNMFKLFIFVSPALVVNV